MSQKYKTKNNYKYTEDYKFITFNIHQLIYVWHEIKNKIHKTFYERKLYVESNEIYCFIIRCDIINIANNKLIRIYKITA